MEELPYYPQETGDTCAAASLRMVLEPLGIKKSERTLAKALKTNKKSGVRVEDIINFVEKSKLCYVVFRNATLKNVEKRLKLGYLIIVGYRHPSHIGHYAILLDIDETHVYLQDPNPLTPKIVRYSKKYFVSLWKRGFKYDKESCWFIGIKQ